MNTFKSTKTFVAFVLIAVCFITNIGSTAITFSGFSDIPNVVISFLPTILILCRLLSENKDFRFKPYLFPLAFGILSLEHVYTVAVFVLHTPLDILFENGVIVSFVFSLLLLLCNILCFIGTLSDGRFSVLLKSGCIGYIGATVAMLLYEFISLGGMEYFQSVPEGMSPVNLLALVRLASTLLFYTGMFILATNKKTKGVIA